MRGSYNPLEEEMVRQRRLGQRDGKQKAVFLFGLWIVVSWAYVFFGHEDFYKAFFYLSLGSAIAEVFQWLRGR
jgi:hypothetical protein